MANMLNEWRKYRSELMKAVHNTNTNRIRCINVKILGNEETDLEKWEFPEFDSLNLVML